MSEPGPLTLEDRLNIYDLLARYSRAMDTLDVDAYLENLTPDARVVDTSGVAFTGHDQLRERFRRRATDYPEPRQHFVGLPVIDGNSEHCSSRTYWIVIFREPDGTHVLKSFGEYIDQWVKQDNRWLVEDRNIVQWRT
jgi:3-phenylpropionate/cinnamic acid dioxygenase small subunit